LEKIFIDKDFKKRESTLLMEFQFHDICNIKCSYCKLNSGKNVLKEIYLDNLYTFIVEKELYKKFNNIEIMIMGGETLIDIKILDYLLLTFKKINKLIKISHVLVLSNFVLCTELIEQQLNKIKDCGFNTELEITLHAQEYSFDQLKLFMKNYNYFKDDVISINVLEGVLTNKRYKILYKHLLSNLIKDGKKVHNVYICDVNKIKYDGLCFISNKNILSTFGIEISSLGNTFINNNKEYSLGYINEHFISSKKCLCNVRNNLVLDASGHVRWCGNFDQFQEDVIPDIKMIPEHFDQIFNYFFTDNYIECPYNLCMGGIFKELKIKDIE